MTNEPGAVIGLTARYPNGSLGEVAAVVANLPASEVTGGGDFASQSLDEVLADVMARYHKMIGQAYAPEDFTYTIWLVDSAEEMYHLCGERILANQGMPDYRRPG